MMKPVPPILECRNVTAGHRNGGGAVVPVVTNVTFAVAAGELWVVLGRSGSGKSTLLRLLNRFDEPLGGEVRYRGAPVATYDPLELRRKVALVLQTPVMFDGTVEDNLAVRPRGEPPRDSARLASTLDEVGLGRVMLRRTARELSVGERQRVAIARALLNVPDILLLDEPTSALDPHATGVIAQLIFDLQAARRLTVLVVTHQPELFRRLAGRVLLLSEGRANVDPDTTDTEAFLAGV